MKSRHFKGILVLLILIFAVIACAQAATVTIGGSSSSSVTGAGSSSSVGTMEAGHSAVIQIVADTGFFLPPGATSTVTDRGPRTAASQALGETATVTGTTTATARSNPGVVNFAQAHAEVYAGVQENAAVPSALEAQTDILTWATVAGFGSATATATGTAAATFNSAAATGALPGPLALGDSASARSTGTSTSRLATTAAGNDIFAVGGFIASDIHGEAHLYENNGGAGLPVNAASTTWIASLTPAGVVGPLAAASTSATGEAWANAVVTNGAISLEPYLVGPYVTNAHARGTASLTGTATGLALGQTLNGLAGIASTADAGPNAQFGTPAFLALPALQFGGLLGPQQEPAFISMSGIGVDSQAGSSAFGGTNTARLTATASGTTDARAGWRNPANPLLVQDRATTDATGNAIATVQNTNSGPGLVPALAFGVLPWPAFIPTAFTTDNEAMAGVGSVNLVGDEIGGGGAGPNVIPATVSASGLGTQVTADGILPGSRQSSIASITGANTHANGALDATYAGLRVREDSRSAASGMDSSQTVFNGIGQAVAYNGNGAVGISGQNMIAVGNRPIAFTGAGDIWDTQVAGTGRAVTTLGNTASSAHAGVTDVGWVPALGFAVSTADSSIRNGALSGTNAITGMIPWAGGIPPGGIPPTFLSGFPVAGAGERGRYNIAFATTTTDFALFT